MNVALLGPSGAGKGTHAATLAALHGLSHVSTGDVFRRNVLAGTPLGQVARRYLLQGELVPDDVVEGMLADWWRSLPSGRGALFDGFPRTVDQIRFLDELLRDRGSVLDAVVYLRVPDSEIGQRLSGRMICQSCQTPYHARFDPPVAAGRCDRCGSPLYAAPDDVIEPIRARLRIFHRTTEPLLRHYAAAGLLAIVSGEGIVADVEARLTAIFAKIRERRLPPASPADVDALMTPEKMRPPPAVAARPGLDLVLLGGPGSGKGTQAEHLSASLHLPHIATGDLFREHLHRATPLGKLARSYMDRGELVPDDVTVAMVAGRLVGDDVRAGFILDGFPRTVHQAEALAEILVPRGRRLAAVIYIKVPDDTIIERLSGRLICEACQAPCHRRFTPPRRAGICDRCGGRLITRADDNPKTVRARLVTFHRQTTPLVEHYRAAGLLHEIDGGGDVGLVTEAALTTVDGLPIAQAGPSRAVKETDLV